MPDTTKTLREEFRQFLRSEGIDNDFLVDRTSDWWLSKLKAHDEELREKIEGLIEKYKSQACVIADAPEYDETNMTRYIENTLIRKIVTDKMDFIRDLSLLSPSSDNKQDSGK